MAPPRAFMAATAWRQPRKALQALVSITNRQSSGEVLATLPVRLTPALLTRISSGPNRLSRVSRARVQSSSWVTSSL